MSEEQADLSQENEMVSENQSNDVEIDASKKSEENLDAEKVSTKATKAEEAQSQKMLKKFLLKVDGQEIEEEIDLNDEETLRRELQLAKAAKKRMQEAQEAKRQVFEIAKAFNDDPLTIFRKMGPKGYELAEQFLYEKIQQEQMSPEQRKMMELEQRVRAYEERERLAQEQAEAQKQEELESRQAEHYQKVIIEALDKSGLPKTPEMAKRAAYLLQKNLELGLDLDASDLVSEMKNEVLGLVKSLTGTADGNALIHLLGPDIAKKIIKAKADEIKAKQPLQTKPIYQGTPPPSTTKSKKYLSWDEWREESEKRLKSLPE